MKIAVLIARILLGLIFVVFGLEFFLHFLKMTAPPLSKEAGEFSSGLYNSHYFFQYMKVLEIVGGLFVLINRFTAFFLLVLLPISLNIFLYHAILAPAGLPIGAGVIALNVFLCAAYFKYYRSVFTLAPTL